MTDHADYILKSIIRDVEHLVEIGNLSSSAAQCIRTALAQGVNDESASDASLVRPPMPMRHSSSQYGSPPAMQPPAAASLPTARLKVPPPPPPSSTRTVSAAPKDMVEAVWAYDAKEANELSFAEGEEVEVISRDSEGWWSGRSCSTGQEGMFPSNYVKATTASVGLDMSARKLPPAYEARTAASTQREWKAPTARFTSGGADEKAWNPQHGSQGRPAVPAQDSGSGPSSHSGLPIPDVEDREKKNAQFKKIGGHVGKSAAGGFGAGVGFGLARSIF